MSNGTPEQVLASIVDGINTGNFDSLMPLFEADGSWLFVIDNPWGTD
jgi:hypothetical protein